MTTLMLRRPLDKKAYRLRCRFKIEPYPSAARLDVEKVRVAERFVRDMRTQGWEHASSEGFKMTGPFTMVQPVTIRPTRISSAREMLPYIARGERFLDKGDNSVKLVVPLAESEWWEYEIAGVFIRNQIMVERADPHEEEMD